MAEYFPLIDRAIANLPDATAEARRAIYERARSALIGQLKKLDPPVPEEDIARESAALDEAIARVEATFADRGAEQAAARVVPPPRTLAPPRPAGSEPPAHREPAPSATVRDPGRTIPRPATRPLAAGAPSAPAASPPTPGATGSPGQIAPRRTGPVAPGVPTGKAPPVEPPPVRERPVIGPAPRIQSEVRPVVAPARPFAPRAGRPPSSFPPGAPGATPRPEAGEPAQAAAETQKPVLPPAADLSVKAPAAQTESEPAPGPEADDAPAPAGEETPAVPVSMRMREPGQRPAAPRPAERKRFGWPVVAGAIVVLVVMAGVGTAAWRLRDRPQAFTAARPVVATAQAPEPGKIVDRAASGQDGTAEGGDTGQATGAAVPPPVGQNTGGDATPALPVAQRAALLVDAPDEPQKVRTYSGTVVWHLDSVSPGQGLPLTPAIKADVDIPDARLKVTMVVQKNLEPQLPASNTIELHFLPQSGYDLGDVVQINVPDMRKDDAPAGDALAGVPVMINPGNFLVGLSRGSTEAQNKRLILERNWFDVSLLFASKHPAKLTFEKGIDGQHLWEQVFAAWGDGRSPGAAGP